MADSRRINANIREEDEKRPVEEQPPFGVYAVILSSEFWPPFKDEKLEVPEDIRAALEVYCKKYEKLKVRLPRLSCLLHQHPCPAAPAGWVWAWPCAWHLHPGGRGAPSAVMVTHGTWDRSKPCPRASSSLPPRAFQPGF